MRVERPAGDGAPAEQHQPALRGVGEHGDVGEGIAIHYEQVGELPGGDAADVLEAAHGRGGARSRDHRLLARQPGLGEAHELVGVGAVRVRVEAHDDRDAGCARRGDGRVGILAQALGLLDEHRGEAAGLHLGDEIEDAQRGHERDAPFGHAGQQVGCAVQLLTVLDRVDAGFHREPDAGESLGVGSDAKALPVRLLDDRLELGGRHLRWLHGLARHRQRPRRHDLDQVGALLDLLAHCLAHLVGPVGLAVHVGEEPATGRRGGDDLAAQHEARPGAQLRTDRAAQREQLTAVGAEVARGRDAAGEHRARGIRLTVRAHVRLVRELAARRGREADAAEVDVRVDQSRQDRAARDVDRCESGRHGATVGDRGDHACLDQHARAHARLAAAAVEDTAADQGEPAVARRRSAVEVGRANHSVPPGAHDSAAGSSFPPA